MTEIEIKFADGRELIETDWCNICMFPLCQIVISIPRVLIPHSNILFNETQISKAHKQHSIRFT